VTRIAGSARTEQIPGHVPADLTRAVESDSLDAPAAAAFLRAQASWLRRGLRLATDPSEVGSVLGTHDASHGSWVSLIAEVERLVGDDAAQQVSQLYGFHGRVVGSLERGLDLRLDAGVQAQVRRMLAERLTQLTDEAVGALSR
jgi:hypothetical protein